MERDHAVKDNSHLLPKDGSSSERSSDSQDNNDSDSDDENDGHLDDSLQKATLGAQTRLPCRLKFYNPRDPTRDLMY